MENKTQSNGIYRIGMGVFILLVALSIGEFAIGATAPAWGVFLLGVAILKAYFIIRDYMHLPRLFSGEEEQS